VRKVRQDAVGPQAGRLNRTFLIARGMNHHQNLDPSGGRSVINRVVADHVAAYRPESPGLYTLSDRGLGCQQTNRGSRLVEPPHCRRQIVSGNVLRDLF
jgi:hypothetical protein